MTIDAQKFRFPLLASADSTRILRIELPRFPLGVLFATRRVHQGAGATRLRWMKW